MQKIYFKFLIINLSFLTFFNAGKSSTKYNPIPVNNLTNVTEKSVINLENKKNLPKYLLGPGDRLLISIYKFDEFSSEVEILPDGTVNLPRVNSIYVRNLTLDEANLLITKSFKKIIKNPIVYINLIQSRPIRINVNGEVQRPGIYSLDTQRSNTISNTDGGEGFKTINKGWPTVLDAISQAGGLKMNANLKEIKLYRPIRGEDKAEEIIFNIWDSFLRGGSNEYYEIFDGDSIFVSSSEKSTQKEKAFLSSTNLAPATITVKVIGEVINPGHINVRNSSPIMEGILNAGGFTKRSNRKKITLLRLNNNGTIEKKTFMNSNSGKKDLFLKDRDVIFVDDNSLSKTSNALKNLVDPIKPILDAATFYKIISN